MTKATKITYVGIKKRVSLLLFFILLSILHSYAASYTWNGATSTAWATTTNWTPNGIPGTGDNVTIVTATNQPTYNGVAGGVTNLTMTSGTLNLGGYTLNVTGTGTFNGGTVSNGKINATGTTTTFAGTTFSCKVRAVTNSPYLNGSIFNDSTYIELTGNSSISGSGGNKYNAFTEIVVSGTGNLYGSYASPNKPDTANADVKFTKKSAGTFYPSRSGIGHQYNGKVILNATTSSTGSLGIGIAATVQYNGNIEVNNPGGAAIYVGNTTSGDQTLASGKTISVGSGGFSSGYLYLFKFKQIGTTTQNITLTGTAYLYFYPTTTFNATCYFEAPNIYLNGARFNGKSTFKKTGGTTNAGSGGNFFNDTLIIHNNTSAGYIMSANSAADTCNSAVYLKNSGSTHIYMSHNYPGIYNGDIYISGTGTGNIYFGNSAGSATLASGKTIKEASDEFTAGSLVLRNFTKHGTTPINLDIASAAGILFYTGSTINGNVTINAGNIYLSGTKFNNKTSFTKTGGSNNAGAGGNVFNDTLTIVNNGSTGYFMTCNTTPDTCKSAVYLTNSGSNHIYMNYNQPCIYNGDIYVAGSGTGNTYFGGSTGTATLASGKTIKEGAAGFMAGALILRSFTKNGTTAINLDLGNAAITFSTGNTINGPVTVSAGAIYLNGTIFNGNADFVNTGAISVSGTGGNTYNGTFKLRHTGSKSYLMNTSTSVSDIFNGDAEFINEATGTGGSDGLLFIAYQGPNMQFNGSKTTFSNKSPVDRSIAVAQFGVTTFNSNIELNNISTTGGSISFGDYSGDITLANGKSITVGSLGYSKGSLTFRGFHQVGSTPISITTTGTSYVWFSKSFNTPTNRSTFDATVTVTAPRIFLNGAIFKNTTSYTATGAYNSVSDGDCEFRKDFSFNNTGSGYKTFANVTRDIFKGNATFTSNSGIFYIANTGTNTFSGNIITNGSPDFYFGNTSGLVVLDSSKAQSISGSATSVQFKKLKINKTAEKLTIARNIIVTDSMIFRKGLIKTGGNLLILNDNCIAATASDSSYADGSVKKIGNDAFTFPVGKNGFYRKIEIGAPSSTTDAFTASYLKQNSNSVHPHSSKDGSINDLSRNEYWTLDRTTGSSNVIVTLSWDSVTSCSFSTIGNTKVSVWDGSNWKDKGNGGTTGNVYKGTVASSSAVSTFGMFALATSDAFTCNPRNYTWNGSSSSTWAGTTNWTPVGIPGSTDNATIVTTSNHPLYDGVEGLTNLTMTSGTLNLNTYTLPITGTGTFNGGTVSNGKLYATGGTTATFAGTTFSSRVQTNTSNLYLNGSVFSDSTLLTKTGATDNWSSGGNHFNGYSVITNKSTAWLILASGSTNPDTANAQITFNQDSSGRVAIAYGCNGNTFYDKVTLNEHVHSANQFHVAYNGGLAFHDTVMVTNTGSGNMYFGTTSNSRATLKTGGKILVGASGFSAGGLNFSHFTQEGSTTQRFDLSGTANLIFQGCTFNGDIDFSSPNVGLHGGVFNGKCTIEQTGSTNNYGMGGNVFNDTLIFTNSGSGYYSTAAYGADTNNMAAYFQNTGTGSLFAVWSQGGTAYPNYFGGDIYLRNTGNSALNVAIVGTVEIDGNIYISNSNSSQGIYFGATSGSTTITAGHTIIEEGSTGFNQGSLGLKKVTKNGTTPMNLDFGTSGKITFGPTSVIGGPMTYSGASFYLNGCTFNGASSFTHNSSGYDDYSSGGNIFNDSATFINSGSSNVYLSNGTGDDYNDNVVFQTSSSGRIFPAYSDTSSFSSNVNVVGSLLYEFGKNGGYVQLDGNDDQYVRSVNGSVIRSLNIRKPEEINTLFRNLYISTTDVTGKMW